MKTIAIEINKLDAEGVANTFNELFDTLEPWAVSELIKSVNDAFLGHYMSESDKLKAMHNFNNFMATMSASREGVEQIQTELNKKLIASL
jgi:hypothetical protein